VKLAALLAAAAIVVIIIIAVQELIFVAFVVLVAVVGVLLFASRLFSRNGRHASAVEQAAHPIFIFRTDRERGRPHAGGGLAQDGGSPRGQGLVVETQEHRRFHDGAAHVARPVADRARHGVRHAAVEEAAADVAEFLSVAAIRCLPIASEEADTALVAAARYGKGRGHPAQLNLGDCFAYALAFHEGTPVLTLDRDFRKTNVDIVYPR
jgi:ribonuclease VapC